MAIWTLLGTTKRFSQARRFERESVVAVYGQINLNLLHAPLEAGDHTLRILAWGGDIKLRVPEHIGITIDGVVVVSDITIETLRTGAEEHPGTTWTSDNFEQAGVRVRIQTIAFFSEIEILHVPAGVAASATDPHRTDTTTHTQAQHSYEGETRRLHPTP